MSVSPVTMLQFAIAGANGGTEWWFLPSLRSDVLEEKQPQQWEMSHVSVPVCPCFNMQLLHWTTSPHTFLELNEEMMVA